MKSFYEPTQEHLTRLIEQWTCSYSGGKDSTCLVTWIEWLRRCGWIDEKNPKLVQSDTGVEESCLVEISRDLVKVLESSGWQCALVHPETHEKLYCQILGRGLPPIHPGIRKLRWCTRSTKIDPMKRWKKQEQDQGILLTGLRFGESKMRDGKIKKNSGCAAGGECGIPDASNNTYSPIVKWTTCHVVDWLNGHVSKDVTKTMEDIYGITERLIEIYDIRIGDSGFGLVDPVVKASRFGCIGCPAIGVNKEAPKVVVVRYGEKSPINRLYAVWHEARKSENRLVRLKGTKVIKGPIRMSVRKILFKMVKSIQEESGIVLMTPQDEKFIHQCWKDKVYPRGWSEADEMTRTPDTKGTFWNS